MESITQLERGITMGKIDFDKQPCEFCFIRQLGASSSGVIQKEYCRAILAFSVHHKHSLCCDCEIVQNCPFHGDIKRARKITGF